VRNLPFSKKWRRDTPKSISITLYTECQESWDRAKREVELGWPVLLLPNDMAISDALLPVAGREVHFIDLEGIDDTRAKEIGIALIHAGATMVIYLDPNDGTIFFKPEVASWAA